MEKRMTTQEETAPYVEVIVGNIGNVFAGASLRLGRETFAHYVSLSILGYGRGAGESVSLLLDGEIISEHRGYNHGEQ